MNRAIEEIERKITLEKKCDKDSKCEYYLAGLADALEIIKKYENEYIVGNCYYVIMPPSHYETDNKVLKMQLYKITGKNNRKYYCFSTYINSKYPGNDLTLSSQGSLKLRVYKTKEEAEKNKDSITIK